MMVTFVSQCTKNARKKTRRVLDAFADRIGDNTWQTVITQEGLQAVRKLLRKTASKNTAVSCHWIRSRSRSELVWVVGRRNAFGASGRVPVNTTKRVLLGNEWETGWTLATSIQILSTLAALLHDLGKATIGFQKKLKATNKLQADPYRHEWISLRLFEAMISGCSDDKEWLQRLVNFDVYQKEYPDWIIEIQNDYEGKKGGFEHFPPLARLVAWLIVTHHRLPFEEKDFYKSREGLREHTRFLQPDLQRFYKNLQPYKHWVRNEKACEERTDVFNFWQFTVQVTSSAQWLKAIKRWSSKALRHPALFQLPKDNNPLLMQLSRLCLMVGDHNYSSLDIDDKKRVSGDKKLASKLIANTDRRTGLAKQSLDEHLLGVASFTSAFARLLPQFSEEMPYLESLSELTKHTSIDRFQWQNKAFNLVKKHRKEARKQGFFAVNLASTGCGKTLGNARVMAALADPEKGCRFTIALGLRVLTMQTGQALRAKLDLDATSLAVLVGGSATKTLFELQQNELTENNDSSQMFDTGSESEHDLVFDQVDYEHCAIDEETLGTIIRDPKAKKLLYAPLVSCTIDHLMSATEASKGGRHIAPMLRLLTSDLVLDEPDDFDQNDLPALSRLVHMAGMLGSNVLLSSATLTPDLVEGLFIAYQKGRRYWLHNLGEKSEHIYCGWFDEFDQKLEACQSLHEFQQQHNKFINKRVKKLDALASRRIGQILPCELPKPPENQMIHYPILAEKILNAAIELHHQHSEKCVQLGKTASIGLIRVANIDPMYSLAKALYGINQPESTQIHLCCYHARQLLLLRSQLENKLDRLLDRTKYSSLFEHSEIKQATQFSNAKHHVFIVLATSVAEVGRDHDYDWAIVEPSSMRSIIQLVGRVWRHRPEKVANKANVYILEKNIKALKQGNQHDGVFNRPGFESVKHQLKTHSCSELIPDEFLKNINAVPRIQKNEPLRAQKQLADLEHEVMANLLNNKKLNYVNAWWQINSATQANVHLQLLSPFRFSSIPQEDFIVQLDDDTSTGLRFRYQEKAWADPMGEDSVNSQITLTEFVSGNFGVMPWLVAEFEDAIEQLSEQLNENDLTLLAKRFATVRLDENKHWCFHPWFGFWPTTLSDK